MRKPNVTHLAIALVSVFGVSYLGYAALGLSTAFGADLVPREAMPRAIAAVSGMTLGSGIVGFAAGGYLMEQLGDQLAFRACALLLGLLALALWGVRTEGPSRSSIELPESAIGPQRHA